jgi:predicted RNA-binding protein YlxR (DUF448 family)
MSCPATSMTGSSTDLAESGLVVESDLDLLDDGRMGGRGRARPDSSAGDAEAPMEGRSRTCIVNRTVLPERDLIRFVVGPDGDIVPDLKSRLPGRGAWVRATHADVSEAVRRKAFARAFRGAGQASGDLPNQVAALLREAALGRLGLARKAGLVVAGFAKVDAAIRSGRADVVLQASDAAENGIAKLAGAMRAAEAAGLPAAMVETGLPSVMLSMALGGEHVIHAALIQDGRSASARMALERYRLFDAPNGDSSNGSGDGTSV